MSDRRRLLVLAIPALVLAGICVSYYCVWRTTSPQYVASEYCRRISEGDVRGIGDLFPERREEIEFIARECAEQIKIPAPRFTTTTPTQWGHHVLLALEGKKGRPEGLYYHLYLNHDGKILYDSIFRPHPAVAIARFMVACKDSRLKVRKEAAEELIRMDVPLQGFDPEEPEATRMTKVSRMLDWWESTSPKKLLAGASVPAAPQEKSWLPIFERNQLVRQEWAKQWSLER